MKTEKTEDILKEALKGIHFITPDETYGKILGAMETYAKQQVSSLQASKPEMLEEANGILRSAYQIATRKGKSTNWEAFTKQVKVVLDKQHRVMYPDQYPVDESSLKQEQDPDGMFKEWIGEKQEIVEQKPDFELDAEEVDVLVSYHQRRIKELLFPSQSKVEQSTSKEDRWISVKEENEKMREAITEVLETLHAPGIWNIEWITQRLESSL